MPDRTRCPRCRKVGFVRLENVIKAGRAERHYFCGACTHAWRTVEDDTSPSRNENPATPPRKG